MTTWPELKLGSHLVRGVAAVALFALMAAVFLAAQFGDPVGFGSDPNITASIGYAMFNIASDAEGVVGAEGFLVAFFVIAIVLDVAVDGAVFLARRERAAQSSSRIVTDGGRELKRALFGGDDSAADERDETDGGEH